jgi:hypothetical protein
MQLPRRTVEEWLTYFEIAPNLPHLFVEGVSDQALLQGLFRARALDVEVRTIEEVDLALVETLNPSPFCSGNRARLAGFSAAIQGHNVPIHNALCLVDKDCDTVVPVLSSSHNLLLTDYASLYATYAEYDFVEGTIGRALRRTIDARNWSVLLEACRFLFAFRVIRYRDWPAAVPLAPTHLLKMHAGVVVLDKHAYSRKFISKNGLTVRVETLVSAVEEVFGGLVGDPRLFIHFHDFVELLVSLLRNMRILPVSFRYEHLLAILKGAAAPDALADQPVIIYLLAWAAR